MPYTQTITMNILVLSNFYPPHHIGGYGMLCLEVVNGLRERGHRVTVLTGTHGVERPSVERPSVERPMVEGHIHRLLTLESDLYYYRPHSVIHYPQIKKRNQQALQRLVADEEPDAIFIWGMWALSKELASEAERLLPHRVVYYLANPWPIDPNLHRSFWEEPATSPLRSLAKQCIQWPVRLWLHAEWQPFALHYEHALCCSEALRDQLLEAHVPLQNTPVIYEGIDLAPYVAQTRRRQASKVAGTWDGTTNDNTTPLRLLFVGTLAEHKGVHTTIEALGALSAAEREQVHLTILGSGHPQYEARLRQLAATEAVEAAVTFHAPIPREELPDFLGDHDALLLPSIWEEPLARIMQEGLASGMVVVGTATGGTIEIIRHNENGLLFPAADSQALTAEVRRLLYDPVLRTTLAAQGQATAIEQFALPRMVTDIEDYLVGIHETTLSYESISPLQSGRI